nr:hypothetical protein [Burkholderia seminalis]
MLIHGARAVLRTAPTRHDKKHAWALASQCQTTRQSGHGCDHEQDCMCDLVDARNRPVVSEISVATSPAMC